MPGNRPGNGRPGRRPGKRPGKRRSGGKNSNSSTASRRTVEFHRKSTRTNDRRIVHNSGGSATASPVSRILTEQAHLPDSFPVSNSAITAPSAFLFFPVASPSAEGRCSAPIHRRGECVAAHGGRPATGKELKRRGRGGVVRRALQRVSRFVFQVLVDQAGGRFFGEHVPGQDAAVGQVGEDLAAPGGSARSRPTIRPGRPVVSNGP